MFRATFVAKALDPARFHHDFNRPLITHWDQRDSSSFLICYRKWCNGRLKSPPNRIRACSIVNFYNSNTLTSDADHVFAWSVNYIPTHWGGCSALHLSPKHLTLHDFITISIVRESHFGIKDIHHPLWFVTESGLTDDWNLLQIAPEHAVSLIFTTRTPSPMSQIMFLHDP